MAHLCIRVLGIALLRGAGFGGWVAPTAARMSDRARNTAGDLFDAFTAAGGF